MPDDPSISEDPSAFSDSEQPGPESNWAESSAPEEAPSIGNRSSFALDMARLWIEEHQRSVMLGAFAAGVFAGALFRD